MEKSQRALPKPAHVPIKVEPRVQPPSNAQSRLLKDPVDVQAEFRKIRDRHAQRDRKKANFLIIGPHGTGKTYGMITAPAPVLIHSFDTDGTECIPTQYIESGQVIVDSSFEGDSVSHPFAFRAWEKEFWRLKKSGFFEHVGTYVIDSWTGFAASMMYEIIKGRGRTIPKEKADFGKDPDIVPEQSDYNVHQKTLANYLAEIHSLPCNTACLGHLLIDQDDKTKRTFTAVMMDGKKFAQNVPTLFSEFYYAETRQVGPGTQKYYYRLVPATLKPARSRLRKDGVLDAEEPQDIRAILKKAGYPYEDKPY